MFDFMGEEEKQEKKTDTPEDDDSLEPKIAGEESLAQLAERLNKAADNILAEREAYKREINQLQARIEELEEQINNNEMVKKLEDDMRQSKKLHAHLEKKVTALIEKLQDLLEEENI